MPPISKQNSNVFNSTFGIEIQTVDAPVSNDDDESYGTFVRPISPFEVASCYRLSRSLTYQLAQGTHFKHLMDGIPAMTSHWIITLLHDRIVHTIASNCEAINTSSDHSLTACPVPAFLNSDVVTSLSTNETWS